MAEMSSSTDAEQGQSKTSAETRARAPAPAPWAIRNATWLVGLMGPLNRSERFFLSIFARAGRNGVESGNHTPKWMGLWMRNIAGQGGRFPKQFNSLPGYLAAHAKQHVP